MRNRFNAAAVRPLKVVAMGGGTGLSTLLHGLKQHVVLPGETPYDRTLPFISELSAIVTVSDDGGSSGRLRKELNVPPPGDIRNCIVALSEKEALLSRLFQYRFKAGEGLEGHSFGNLFLSAMADITGDFSEAVKLRCSDSCDARATSIPRPPAMRSFTPSWTTDRWCAARPTLPPASAASLSCAWRR